MGPFHDERGSTFGDRIFLMANIFQPAQQNTLIALQKTMIAHQVTQTGMTRLDGLTKIDLDVLHKDSSYE